MRYVLKVVLRGSGVDINDSRRNLASFRVLKVNKIERRNISECVDIDHAPGLALAEELVNSHCELGAVGKVVSHRILAADIVANLHRTALHFHSEFLELFLKKVVEKNCLRDFAELRVTVLVISEVNSGFCSLFCDLIIVEKTLSCDDGTVVDSEEFSLHDCRD